MWFYFIFDYLIPCDSPCDSPNDLGCRFQFHGIPRLTKSLRLWMFDAAQKNFSTSQKWDQVEFVSRMGKKNMTKIVFNLIHMETDSVNR